MGKNEAAAEQASAPVQKIDYEVINSDMIIVGAGLGAISAAFELVKKGQRVTIIDKGPYGFSGGAGFNWDLISTWYTDLEAYKTEVFLSYQVNQETYKNAGEIMAAEKDMELEWLNWGQTFPDRKEDGCLSYYVDMPINKGMGSVFPRYSMDELAKSPLVTIYDRTMVTDLVINDGRCTLLNRFGFYAARCAMDYVKNAAAPESIDLSVAEEEFSRLHELRTRKIEGGLRPHIIRHRIQEACGTCMGIVREKAKLEAAFVELQRIRDEDIPKMIVSSDTKTFNTEWKEAIENYNLLDAALLAVEATLLRKESRGAYLYVDYPEMDNENFNCMLAAKKVDGKAVFTKVELPTVEW